MPERLSPPLRQDAILLERKRHNTAARAKPVFLRSREAVSVIASFEHALPTLSEKTP